jgi:AcrR family transcriptional regulator
MGESVDDRLISAALRCIARWGLAKTTLEDVAREAGCSRATLYRTFPGGKEALFDAVGQAELDRLFGAIAAVVAGAEDLEDALVGVITLAGRTFASHRALQFLLAHEPGVVLPYLAFRHLDVLLARVRHFGGPLLARFLGSEDEAASAAEWVARIVISYLCSPAAGVDLTDDDSVRRLVRTFVLPGLLVPTA